MLFFKCQKKYFMRNIQELSLKYSVAGLIALVLFTMRLGFGFNNTSASDITPQNIMDAVNLERTSRNIPALNYNNELAAAAQYKSSDMIARNYFSHVDPEGHYIWDKIVAEGYYPYTILGENLAINFPNTEGLMSAWMDSPEHRSNILNQQFQDQGAGVAFGNTNAGQFEDAIANTFGAKPARAQTQTTPSAKPSPSATPKNSTPPAQTKSPAPASPAQAKTQAPPIGQLTLNTAGASALARIDLNSITTQANIKNGELDLHVSANIAGGAQNVNAAVANYSIALVPAGNALSNGEQNYSGDLFFSQYFNWQKQNLILTAQGANSKQDSVTVPLANLKLAAGTQNPKALGNLGSKIQNPDLYNVYKYVVIVFGLLFIVFFIVDTFKEIKRKARNFFFGSGSHLVIIFLIISTLLLVNWWH